MDVKSLCALQCQCFRVCDRIWLFEMPNSEKLCEVTELEIFRLLGCLLWTGVKKQDDEARHLFLEPCASWPLADGENSVGKTDFQIILFKKKKFKISNSSVPNLEMRT